MNMLSRQKGDQWEVRMRRRKPDSSHVTELFITAGLIAALAAAVLMPTTLKIHANEARAEQDRPMLTRGSRNALPLPPIPYLETMPWLVQERTPKGLKIDTLLAPKFEMDPALAGEADDGAPLSALEYSRKG
jgi:hypothetical protein